MAYFGEDTPEEKDCQCWKPASDIALVPRWLEEWHVYLGRVADYFEQKQAALQLQFENDKRKLIAEDPELAAMLSFCRGENP